MCFPLGAAAALLLVLAATGSSADPPDPGSAATTPSALADTVFGVAPESEAALSDDAQRSAAPGPAMGRSVGLDVARAELAPRQARARALSAPPSPALARRPALAFAIAAERVDTLHIATPLALEHSPAASTAATASEPGPPPAGGGQPRTFIVRRF